MRAREDVWSVLAGELMDLWRAEDLGVEYLASHPDEAQRERLVQSLSAGPGGTWWPTPEAAAVQMRQRVRQDFVDGEIVRVGGWQLSRSMLRLCALGVIVARAENGEPLGFFAAGRSGESRRVRRTCPSVTIPVARGATRFELPVRSLAPFAQRVAVHSEGRPLFELVLADHEWQRVELNIPAGYAGRDLSVELRIDPAWKPAGDFRTLGIEVPWERPAAT